MSEQRTASDPQTPSRSISFGMILLRYALPVGVVLAGAIVMSLGSEAELEGGAGIAGAGLAIFAMNWLIRASTEGDREREREEQAREYFDAHGRWPDEADALERRSVARSGASAEGASRPTGATTTQRRLERPSRPRIRGERHP